MDDFSDRSQKFLAWFKSQRGATFHDEIEITDMRHRHAGRGIGESLYLTVSVAFYH